MQRLSAAAITLLTPAPRVDAPESLPYTSIHHDILRMTNAPTRRPSKRVRRSSEPAAVALVSMPFKDLRHPPIQLGILQQCLTRAGIRSRAHSAELAFMEYLHASGEP